GAADGPAALRVRVLDPTGATVPGASVAVEAGGGELRDTVTDGAGTVELAGLPAGRARVQAGLQGFESSVKEITLKPGRNAADLTLRLARLSEELSVQPDDRASSGQGYGQVLTEEEIASLPDDPEELEAALRQLAGPGAVLRVNGFSGGRLPPKSQIRQVRIQMNPYSAEYHEAGHMAVDIITKPGLGQWRTGLKTSLRDRALNARPPLAPAAAADTYHRYGFTLEGPLWSQRTSLSLSVDGRLTDGERTVFAATPTGTLSALDPTTADKFDVQARVEHALSAAHTLRAEYQRLGHRQEGLASSGLDLPERAYAQDEVDHYLRLSETGALGARVAAETLFELRLSETTFDPRSADPAVQVLGAFSAGGAQLEGWRRATSLMVAQSFDWGVKNHALRAGFKLESEWQRSDERRNAAGTFTFASLQDWAAGRPASFTRRTGDFRVDVSHTQAAFYVQDEIKLGRKAVLSAGLRNELQSHAGGALNLSPRLGLAYALDSRTTLRAAGGLFRGWYPASLHAETVRLDGEHALEQVIRDPRYPDPFAAGDLAAVPPSVLRRGQGLSLPLGVRTSAGLERTMGALRLRLDYSYEAWSGLLRSRNLNAPAADGQRPDPGQGNLLEIASSGRSRKHSAFANLARMQPGSRYGFALGYVFTHARSDGDAATGVPATSEGLEGEWGPAADDIRHRVFGFGRARLGRGFALATMLRFESGAPFAVTSGRDANGDGLFNDRPHGVGRNAGRGEARFNLDARLSWTLGFGPERDPGGGRPRIVRIGDGEMPPDLPGAAERRYQASVYLQAFNATNRTNARRYAGVVTSPHFGRPLEADPGRRLELGVSLAF
ncbi:MAG TPA: TonB-dependent receptor, partial [Vicinamibacteria bacterium]|nr:TonB-dependent receptor [Vicinamibacteria bacterium]